MRYIPLKLESQRMQYVNAVCLIVAVVGFSIDEIQQNVDYPNVSHPKRQISEPTFSSFYVPRTKNQPLLHAIKYCVISIKYCILYILYCIVMVALS